MNVSLLADLRVATRASHAELDRRLDLRLPDLTRARYVSFLRGSLSATEPLEKESARWLGAREEIGRTARIRADLRSMGEDPESRDLPLEIAPTTSHADAMGITYVLEGSTLGGLAMMSSVDETLRLNGESLSYLRFHGAQTKGHWRAFLTELEAWSTTASNADHVQACASANAAFDVYARAFERAGAFGSAA